MVGCRANWARRKGQRSNAPQTLLVDSSTGVLKLCDFGSAKMLVEGEPNVAYICSRYYRAPELIFGATNYTTNIGETTGGGGPCGCGRGRSCALRLRPVPVPSPGAARAGAQCIQIRTLGLGLGSFQKVILRRRSRHLIIIMHQRVNNKTPFSKKDQLV